jgi:hypothetical protein
MSEGVLHADGGSRIVEKIEQAGEIGRDPFEAKTLIEARSVSDVIEAMNRRYAVVLVGGRAIVMEENPEAPIEDRVRMLSVDGFHQFYANSYYETRDPRDGKVRAQTVSKIWFQSPARRSFSGLEFFPDRENAPGTPGYFNLWRGFSVKPKAKKNGWSIFRDHLQTNICGSDKRLFEWLLAWFAHMFQHPRERIGTAVVLRGRMGSGKSVVGGVIGSLIAQHFWAVDDQRYITGQFNSHQASCLFLQCDEGVWAGDKSGEGRLKSLVTSDFNMIEFKGVDPVRTRNYVRLLFTSNESWVVPAGSDERRFAVFDVNPRVAQQHDYFAEMYAELNSGGREALLHDLLNLDLSKVNLRQIPMTGALLEQKIRSADPITEWWIDRLMAGDPVRSKDGRSAWDWASGPIRISSRELVDDYIRSADSRGQRRRASDTQFGIAFKKLLPDSRRVKVLCADPTSQSRENGYEMPSLDACRSAFEASYGQTINWPNDAPGETWNGGVEAI